MTKEESKMEKTDLEKIADLVSKHLVICKKEVLTSDEVALYLGISKSYLYKLTMKQEIPHYKPLGKICYFNRTEIEKWAQQNQIGVIENVIV